MRYRYRAMTDDVTFSMSRATLTELLTLLHVGAHALEEAGSATSINLRSLETLILARVRDAGAPELVFEEEGKLVPSEEVRTAAHKLFDDFIEESFWEELISRLAKRDFLQTLTIDDAARLEDEDEDLPPRAREHRTPYEREFDTFGLDRLKIDKNAPVSDLRDIL